ncbi:NACHT domain-containing protein [Sorangium sp. So ce302]|uniref:NACHT domain-containing protein n=1 Tax=Sorangium sp. So ce302 TaxID=3133297 RepID=UPI003F607309
MSDEGLFCLPVVRVGGVFRQATSADCSVKDLLPYHELSAFLMRHYTVEPATVHVFGRSADVAVFVPRTDPGDVAYILVDSDFVPALRKVETSAPRDERSARLRDALALHLDALATTCRATDGLFSPTRLNLPYGFIRPSLQRRRIDMFGLPSGHGGGSALKCSIEDVASEPRAVILGAPGSGKTTLLRFLAMRLAAECVEGADSGESRPVPVYVQLRSHDFRSDLSAATVISSWRESTSNSTTLRFAWVLDGLDEVPSASLAAAKRAIKTLVTRSKHDAVFLCSRITSYDGFLDTECAHFELEPFSWTQTSQWIHQYVREFDESRTKSLLHHLANVPELRAIASNPLLLSVLTHQYQFEGVIPQQRVQLLERFVSTLCVDWDLSRGVSRGDSRGVPSYRRSTVLGWLAFEMKSRGATSLRGEDVESWLAKYPPLGSSGDSLNLLRKLAEDTGLLVASRTDGAWEFSHSVFCDYLVARHLISRTEDVVSLLEALAEGDSWHDVWILACAITDDARPLVERVLASQSLMDETKALLVTGALAQGLNLDAQLTEKCRELLGVVFARHSDELAGMTQLHATRSGPRLAVRRASQTGNVGEETRGSRSFVRSFLMLLYRARWWRMAQTVVSDIRVRGGALGEYAAQVFEQEGTLALSDPAGSTLEEGMEELIIEVDTSSNAGD